MLKSLQRYANLNKVDNGIIVCMRQFNRKMQDQYYQKQKHPKQNFNDNDNRKLGNFRKWIPVSEPKQPGLFFSVLNYNLLSQELLDTHSYLYRDHTQQSLRWNQRFYNLVGEILYNNPDILCCQVRVAQFTIYRRPSR